jgi:hypothetical protein
MSQELFDRKMLCSAFYEPKWPNGKAIHECICVRISLISTLVILYYSLAIFLQHMFRVNDCGCTNHLLAYSFHYCGQSVTYSDDAQNIAHSYAYI